MKDKKGFTLIELLAVIVILGMIMIIAVPKVYNSIISNKKKTFIINAKNIVRQLEYDNLEFDTFTKIPLEDLNLKKIPRKNIDLKNSVAYIVDDEIVLDLVGKSDYKDFYLCNLAYTNEDYTVQNTPCDNEHNLIYIDFAVDLDGGSTSQNFNTKYLSGNYLVLEIPKKTNDTFLGWELVSGNSILDQNRIKFGTESTKIMAIWGNNPDFVVNLNGGTSSQKFDSKYSGGSLIILQEPTREGYKFKGWNLVVGNAILSGNILTTGTTNTVIEAVWELSGFSISYELNGGTKGENAPSKGNGGSPVVISNPTRTGYTFKGWDVVGTGASISGTILTIGTSNVILVANWELTQYTISYNLNGGTSGESAPTTGTYGSTIEVSNPTKEGHTFKGWEVSGIGAVLSGTNLTIGGENIILTATWYKLPVLASNYPQDKTVSAYSSVTSEVVISSDGDPSAYTYQWYKDGEFIPGATESSYTIIPTNLGTITLYCEVTNAAGTVITRTATITTSRVYLYNKGDECQDVTGGWKNVRGWNDSSVTIYMGGYSDNGESFSVSSGSGNYYSLLHMTQNKIDLTNISAIYIESISPLTNYGWVCVSTDESWYSDPKITIDNVGTTFKLDVSNLSGMYYVGAYAFSSFNDQNVKKITISEIYME